MTRPSIYKQLYILSFLALIVATPSCKKYLDKKPDKSQVVPSTLSDLLALMDRIDVINQRSPSLAETLADDYYVTSNDWQSLSDVDLRMNYIWNKDATFLNSWSITYQFPIYYSNIVLDQLNIISYKDSENNLFNAIKGAALFARAFMYQRLSDLYCRPYSPSASTDPGLVLRLNANINEVSVRSTVQKTYDQIIEDLLAAADLLPETSIYPSRPTKASAYGALARTYLSMRDYNNAGKYADLCLQKNSSLIDYNTLVPVQNLPIPNFNKETLYYNVGTTYGLSVPPLARIDSTLYKSYADDDLRKTLFFASKGDGTYDFQGSYASATATWIIFDGIATDEMYLVRAECAARKGDLTTALADLNTLLKNRWKTGSFTNITASSANDALTIILRERRKELVFRGLRWSDLRRYNEDGAAITLQRTISNTTYTLPAKDPRWVLLIPLEILKATSIAQNPR